MKMNQGIRRLIDRNIHSEDSDKKKMARMLEVMVEGVADMKVGLGSSSRPYSRQDIVRGKCEDLDIEIGKIINES